MSTLKHVKNGTDLFRSSSKKESAFQRKLLPKLRAIPNSWFAVKEAAALRGLPDIYGCINGTFVTLECKKSEEESQETTGRVVLQRKTLEDVRKAGGYASFIYPENMKYILQDLLKL